MKIIDLTQDIHSGMPVYPGDPPVRITQVADLKRDGYTVFKMQLNDQIGTHVETQYHMIAGRMLVHEGLDRCIGRARVVDVPCGRISASALAHRGGARRCKMLLLRSGYSEAKHGINVDDDERPVLDMDAIKWIVKSGITLMGIDCFDFDQPPDYLGHKYLLKHNIIIVEGLTNLSLLTRKTVKLFVIPLRIRGVGASPCRAFAIEE